MTLNIWRKSMVNNALSCFKAYDIRGRIPDEFNLEIARQIGLAFTAEFSLKNVCIGYDMRLTSYEIARVLAAGFMDAGADVTLLDLCGTEEVYFATFSQGFDGGVMVTASHNPSDWNGLKLVLEGAKPVSMDSGLAKIRERILRADLPIAVTRGNLVTKSFRKEFIEHLLSYIDVKELAPLTIVANAGNGCAWLPIQEIAPHLPCKIIGVNKEPDGTFPNGVPNPLLPDNRDSTAKAVLEHKADMGIAFDGDFDRCFLFDEKGQFIEGYYSVGLLAQELLKKHPGEKILHDPRLVWNTQDIVKSAGGICIETKSGHTFIKERMRAENALYGGEMSAHHYFREFSFCDSGMLTWLLSYALLSHTGKPLSVLVKEQMKNYPVSGEINIEIADQDKAIKRVEDRFCPDALSVSYLDGVSIEYPNWRCNIRKSNTEPFVRLNVEARGDKALLKKMTDELCALLH